MMDLGVDSYPGPLDVGNTVPLDTLCRKGLDQLGERIAALVFPFAAIAPVADSNDRHPNPRL